MLILSELDLQSRRNNYAFICGHFCEIWREFPMVQYDFALQECRRLLDEDSSVLFFVVKDRGTATVSIWRQSSEVIAAEEPSCPPQEKEPPNSEKIKNMYRGQVVALKAPTAPKSTPSAPEKIKKIYRGQIVSPTSET